MNSSGSSSSASYVKSDPVVKRRFLEKVGSIGAVIGALACPICFPKIAIVGAAIGLGVVGTI